jgi:hypothetical protein
MSHRREHFLLQLGRFRCSGASRSNSKNQFARLPSSAAVSGYASVRPLPPSGLAWIGLTARYCEGGISDATVKLHDRMYGVRKGDVENVFKIER